METGLTLLTKASIPKSYWPYAFATVVYLINRMPTLILSLKSPFAILFYTNPNYHKQKIFGCLCYPLLRPYNTNKLESHSLIQSAYLCLEPKTNRLYTSCHVCFDETSFPFHQLQQKPHDTSDQSHTDNLHATQIPFIPPPFAPAHFVSSEI